MLVINTSLQKIETYPNGQYLLSTQPAQKNETIVGGTIHQFPTPPATSTK
ncbi:MAG TPA: hypothetical protein PKA12_02875 [Saprospiraceae bacterium]|nr:hypothetical protein [Saprospiraceae bacterium]